MKKFYLKIWALALIAAFAAIPATAAEGLDYLLKTKDFFYLLCKAIFLLIAVLI